MESAEEVYQSFSLGRFCGRVLCYTMSFNQALSVCHS